MKLIECKTNQCVAASFAMVMGVDMNDLLDRLGHNGLDTVVEDVSPPACYRSFHPQEFIDLLIQDGYAATMIELDPHLRHGPKTVNHAFFLGHNRFFQALLRGDGVIFGALKQADVGYQIGHAVAWDATRSLIYDPRGYTYPWTEGQDFQPRQFFLIQKVEAPCMMKSTALNKAL